MVTTNLKNCYIVLWVVPVGSCCVHVSMFVFFVVVFSCGYRAREETMRHRRINEAYSLMNDILSSKPVVHPIPSLYSAARPISPRAAAKEQTLKEKETRKKKKQATSKPSQLKARAEYPAVHFNYPAPKKSKKEAKVPVVGTITDSDPSKSSKKVQFSNTRGTFYRVIAVQFSYLTSKKVTRKYSVSHYCEVALVYTLALYNVHKLLSCLCL